MRVIAHISDTMRAITLLDIRDTMRVMAHIRDTMREDIRDTMRVIAHRS